MACLTALRAVMSRLTRRSRASGLSAGLEVRHSQPAFALMGEVLIFRTAHAAVVRRLGWQSLDKDKADLIRHALFPTAASPSD